MKKKLKIVAVFGTRPEVIKMAPVILELRKYSSEFELVTICSGQHREMLHQSLSAFNIMPDYDLHIMTTPQSLFDVSTRILTNIEKILKVANPNLVLVQGDTPTAFTGALAAFYSKIPIGHIEAGLRTYNKYNPFPEEMNRQLIDVLADLFFVPTAHARNNLLKEGKPKDRIWITGNTAIDALALINGFEKHFKNRKLAKLPFRNKRIILLTCHRRESWGKKMEEIFKGVKRVVDEFEDVEVIFPVHLNPLIRQTAEKILGSRPKIHLVKSLSYPEMVKLINKSYLVATDSGGLQEEAPHFGKPVVVLRNVTERVEGVESGTLVLGGTSEEGVYKTLRKLLTDNKLYKEMSEAKNPYGDGKASQRIRRVIGNYFTK